MFPKYFTLEEARALLPSVRDFVTAANVELERLAEDLVEANGQFDRLERRITKANVLRVAQAPAGQTGSFGFDETSLSHGLSDEEQQSYEKSAHELAQLQENYLIRLNYWLDKINDCGAILRDLRSGLLDFPAREGEFEYFLCWRLSDDDISHWHLINDGFIGRKPLAVLIEYV